MYGCRLLLPADVVARSPLPFDVSAPHPFVLIAPLPFVVSPTPDVLAVFWVVVSSTPLVPGEALPVYIMLVGTDSPFVYFTPPPAASKYADWKRIVCV